MTSDSDRVSRRRLLRLFAALAVLAGARGAGIAGIAPSNFKRVYGSPAERRAFELFLQTSSISIRTKSSIG